MRLKYSQEDDQQIIDYYQHFYSAQEINKLFGYSETQIYRVLDRNNISRRNNAKCFLIDIPEVSKDQVVSLYNNGASKRTIANQSIISYDIIDKILQERQVACRKGTDHLRKFPVNHLFFDVIDTEVKAYFLGLMYADGNVYNNLIRISLQQEDKYILEQFRDIIVPNKPLKFKDKSSDWVRYHKRTKNQYELCMTDTYVAYQLKNLGCPPAKSLILKFPEFLTNSPMLPHFIRGYMDGDGCIKGKKNFQTTFVSTRDFNTQLAQILVSIFGIASNISVSNPKRKNRNQITTTLTISGNRQVKKVLEWLYKDATIFLVRKYDKFQNLLKRCADVDARFPNRHYK